MPEHSAPETPAQRAQQVLVAMERLLHALRADEALVRAWRDLVGLPPLCPGPAPVPAACTCAPLAFPLESGVPGVPDPELPDHVCEDTMRASVWQWQSETRTRASPLWPLPYPDGDPLMRGGRRLILVLRQWVYQEISDWMGTAVGNLPQWAQVLERLRTLDAEGEVSPAERAEWAALTATDEPQVMEDELRCMGLPWGGPRLYWYVQDLLCGQPPAAPPLRAALVTTLVFEQRDDPALVGGLRAGEKSLTKDGDAVIVHDGNPMFRAHIEGAFLVEDLQEAVDRVQRRHAEWLRERSTHLLQDQRFIQKAVAGVTEGPVPTYLGEALDAKYTPRLARELHTPYAKPKAVFRAHLDRTEPLVRRALKDLGLPSSIPQVAPGYRAVAYAELFRRCDEGVYATAYAEHTQDTATDTDTDTDRG